MKRLIKEYYYKPHLLLNHCYYVSASRLVIVPGVHLEGVLHVMMADRRHAGELPALGSAPVGTPVVGDVHAFLLQEITKGSLKSNIYDVIVL